MKVKAFWHRAIGEEIEAKGVIIKIITAWAYIIIASAIFLSGYVVAGLTEFDRGFLKAATLCAQGKIERGNVEIAGAGGTGKVVER